MFFIFKKIRYEGQHSCYHLVKVVPIFNGNFEINPAYLSRCKLLFYEFTVCASQNDAIKAAN